jgi:hypothetical protein
VTAPAFRLAGSGWYETDFKKEGDRKRNLADSGEPAKAATPDKGAETKPEPKPKPETKPVAAPATKASSD